MNARHSIHDKDPWFHPDAVKYLSSIIKLDWAVLETGSGSSTVWYATRTKRVVSFENSRRWHAKMEELLESKKIKNVDLRLRPDYQNTGICGFEKNEFDFVSIDGCRDSRVSSVMSVTPFLKSGGYLLFDNSENKLFEKAIIFLNKWPSKVFGTEWQTTVWRKS